MCGEVAGDPLAVPLLLGLGATELSMNAVAIPAAKQAVRLTDLGEARRLARAALAAGSAADVRTSAARVAATCGTELDIVQEGVPAVIPLESCYLGWQESLTLLAKLVEAEIPDEG